MTLTQDTKLQVPWLRAFFIAAGLFVTSSCSCEDEKKKTEDLSRPPAPLVVQTAPQSLQAQVFPLAGSTSPHPVVIVLSAQGTLCKETRAALGKLSHVLCSAVAPPQLEKETKKALAYLKATYPRHIAVAPVVLIAGPQRSEVAWRLMLAEPQFFSHSYIEGLKERVLTFTTLQALNSGGAKTLALDLPTSKRLDFLAQVAKRRGLQLRAVGKGAKSRSEALQLLLAADPRFSNQ